MDLAGRVAVVTGSGRGLGWAYAQALVEGLAVVVDDVAPGTPKQAVMEPTVPGGQAVAEVAAVGKAPRRRSGWWAGRWRSSAVST